METAEIAALCLLSVQLAVIAIIDMRKLVIPGCLQCPIGRDRLGHALATRQL